MQQKCCTTSYVQELISKNRPKDTRIVHVLDKVIGVEATIPKHTSARAKPKDAAESQRVRVEHRHHKSQRNQKTIIGICEGSRRALDFRLAQLLG